MNQRIRIYDATGDNSKPRAWLSSGTELATGGSYVPEAYVPKGPWRLPGAAEERALFTSHTPATHGECVAVVKAPQNLQSAIEKLDLSALTSIEEFVEFVQNAPYQELQESLIAFLNRFRRREESYLRHSPVFSPAGLPTVTVGPDGQNFLGLHLDSWYSLDLATRNAAPNRISINLGRDDRYFLFLNLPMTEIVREVPVENRKLGDVVTAYLARNPEFPVVKVRIAPGEAYIAPTENLIHDGCSLDKRAPDVHLTLRGFFTPG